MKILTTEIEKKIQARIIPSLLQKEYDPAIRATGQVIDELYANIPENKRISYGRVHTIRVLSEYLYTRLAERGDGGLDDMKQKAPVFEIASGMFGKGDNYKVKGVALGMLSLYGLEDHTKVLPYFESAASSSHWDMRELAQMFFRRLIKRYPDEMKEYLLRLVDSEDANIRRFVGETLRPVQENRWFYEDPDYPLSILRNMFKESSPYPRTSVGNNLSDLARRQPDLVFSLVEELVETGDRNSRWIAYRACRNLVKAHPEKVMSLLGVDEYHYKERRYKRQEKENRRQEKENRRQGKENRRQGKEIRAP